MSPYFSRRNHIRVSAAEFRQTSESTRKARFNRNHLKIHDAVEFRQPAQSLRKARFNRNHLKIPDAAEFRQPAQSLRKARFNRKPFKISDAAEVRARPISAAIPEKGCLQLKRENFRRKNSDAGRFEGRLRPCTDSLIVNFQ